MKRLHEVRRFARVASASPPAYDGRALLLAAVLFIFAVVSAGKYALRQVLALAVLLPVALICLQIPGRVLVRKMIFVSPWVIFLGIFNPLFDTAPMVSWGPVTLSGGWIAFMVMACKAILSVAAALILTESLSMPELAMALQRLKVPAVLVTQWLFLHRYLYLLVEEGQSMHLARGLRSSGKRGLGLQATASLLGSLFLRTLDRGERIHRCMLARHYSGRLLQNDARPLTRRDMSFLGIAALGCFALRLGVP